MATPEVGDLAVYAHPHCQRAGEKFSGQIGIVTEIFTPPPGKCPCCGAMFPQIKVARLNGRRHPLAALDRISPLSELEHRSSEETLFQPEPPLVKV